MRLSGLDLRKLLALAAPLVLLGAACSDDSGGDSNDAGTEEADDDSGDTLEDDTGACDSDDVTFTATAKEDELDEVVVYTEPDGEELETLPTTWAQDLEDPEIGSPVTFLVTDETHPDDEPEWYHVALPVPDNGSEGYIRAGDVEVRCNEYQITIDLDEYELTVSLRGVDIINVDVGLGIDERATQPGEYYITQLIRNVNPDDAYGPFAYALNGFSDDEDILEEFDTEGQGYATVGIHGTNQPELIPGDVSNGCIRMENENIEWIREQDIPLGTPVHVI